jgi:hypothetical protein
LTRTFRSNWSRIFARQDSRPQRCLNNDSAAVVISIYPPEDYPGLIVLRLGRQDKPHVLDVFRKLLKAIGREPLEGRLWIVEENRIRIR